MKKCHNLKGGFFWLTLYIIVLVNVITIDWHNIDNNNNNIDITT